MLKKKAMPQTGTESERASTRPYAGAQAKPLPSNTGQEAVSKKAHRRMSENATKPSASERANAIGNRITTTQQKILAEFRVCGILSMACRTAGAGRSTHYTAMTNSQAYRVAFGDAQEEAADRIEQEAYRRAVEGVEEPVFYQGNVCGVIRKYSDQLLVRLLAARKPREYGTHRAEITGKDGQALGAQPNEPEHDWSRLTDDELNTMLRLQKKLCGLPENREGGD